MSIDLINEFGEIVTVTRYGQSIQTVVLTFDADFVMGNNIDLDIDIMAITQVPFNANHATTMTDLAAEMALSAKIDSVTVTAAREITIVAVDPGSDLLIDGIVVTGGASQASGSVNQIGGYIDGIYQDGATSTFDVIMSIQPLMGKEVEKLPEGERTRRYVKGYTTTRLYTTKESESQKADRVAYDGTNFEVQAAERWIDGNLHHYKTMMAEVS